MNNATFVATRVLSMGATLICVIVSGGCLGAHGQNANYASDFKPTRDTRIIATDVVDAAPNKEKRAHIPADFDPSAELRQQLQQRLPAGNSAMAAAAGQRDDTITLASTITQYEPGDAFQRWLMPGLGHTVLTVAERERCRHDPCPSHGRDGGRLFDWLMEGDLFDGGGGHHRRDQEAGPADELIYHEGGPSPLPSPGVPGEGISQPRRFAPTSSRVDACAASSTMCAAPRRTGRNSGVPMLKLAAFADEISPELDEQIRVCRENGVTHFELRSVNNINVLDFDKGLRNEIRAKLQGNGMGVVSIGSPIGKVKITDSWGEHLERFKIAVEGAEFFAAPYVRLFSYYPPEKDGDIRRHRDEVMRRMAAKVEYVKDRPVALVHENEVGVYGARGPECVDLMRTIDSPKLRHAFDFANFVQAGDDPLDNWPSLKPYTVHIHIKDALKGSGKVVPAGEGDGKLAPILVDAWKSGYRGFLSLEPHLAKHEQFGGFSGPELFKVAVDALKELCGKNGIE